MSLCCLQAVIRRGAGEVTHALLLPPECEFCWSLPPIKCLSYLTSFQWPLAGRSSVFLRNPWGGLGDAERGKELTFFEVYPSQYSASCFMYVISFSLYVTSPKVNFWFPAPRFWKLRLFFLGQPYLPAILPERSHLQAFWKLPLHLFNHNSSVCFPSI